MAAPTPSPSPNPVRPDALNQLGAAPADPGNPNAPTNNNPLLPQSGIIQMDPQTNLPVATISVNGKLITLTLNSNLTATQTASLSTFGGYDESDKSVKKTQTLQEALGSISSWYTNTSQRQKYINEMYEAGLVSSKKSPSAAEVALAWQLVVQEAALQLADPSGDSTLNSPDAVLAKAAQQGWNSISAKQSLGDVGVNGTGNLNNTAQTSSQSETIYKSYVDPATAMGTLADSYFRLMGRNPTSGEYNAFLHTLYSYQQQENTGKFEKTTKGPNTDNIDTSTDQPVDQSGSTGGTSTQTNVVSQRGIGTRGVQFLAGQQALASPESGAYQAATTYFNAFIKALQGPASGMAASGPTVAIP
jgi:hypothetical protein